MSLPRSTVAVIGAGFSGTMTALHLVKSLPDARILLCERGPVFARGAAYSTDDPVHLLNVRAGNMSAFADRPDHFETWLRHQADLPPDHLHETKAGRFVSRKIYGRYLSQLIEAEVDGRDGLSRLSIVPDDVTGLDRAADGGFELRLAGGRRHRVASAVLAVGNLLACPDGTVPGRRVNDPWGTQFTEGLSNSLPVVVVGTGLTMVDVAASLWRARFPGPVFAMSRRGLAPHGHVQTDRWELRHFGDVRGASLNRLLAVMRREAVAAADAGTPWQSVMDAVRPLTSDLWRSLGAADQSRFIRHLRPWWDIHRHRMAPPLHALVRRLVDSGYLRLHAGRIRSVDDAPHGVTVRWCPRGGGDEQNLEAERIIFATGQPNMSACRDPLVERLLDRGLARIDRHGLGLEATDRLQVVGGNGSATPGLWAIGPIVRGSFWECTAVPDIRRDAQRLAFALAAERTLAEAAPA